VEEEDEQHVLVPIEEGGANLSQMLDNPSSPKVDKKEASYVTRGSNKRKAPSSETQVLEKKGHFWGRNLKSVNVQVAKERKANEEFIDHEQESSKG
jgi:hypothetical protein